MVACSSFVLTLRIFTQEGSFAVILIIMALQTFPAGPQFSHCILLLCDLELTEFSAEVQLFLMLNVTTDDTS